MLLPDQKFQFERHGYFVADRVDHVHTGTKPVFNLAVGLKDSWGKVNGALVGIDVQHASERADLTNLSLSKLPFGELLAA
jgi:hypothetical protein